MELAIHLRNGHQRDPPDRWNEHIASLYEQDALSHESWIEEIGQPFSRAYLGDEFCSNRLPKLEELGALLRICKEWGKGITFLTPPLTDDELERHASLFDRLQESDLDAEVVFNDWGILMFLKERYPAFELSAGRLLNKGFKDPRLLDAAGFSSSSIEAASLLGASSFDQRQIQDRLLELGVTRIERDLLPYAEGPPAAIPGLETSIYFPFGYLATGRVCWMSGFSQGATERFVPLKECPRPCGGAPLRIKSDSFSTPVIQSGNTLHYLYTPPMLAAILDEARRKKLRLVYQGFAV
jgi:hypothetical protein